MILKVLVSEVMPDLHPQHYSLRRPSCPGGVDFFTDCEPPGFLVLGRLGHVAVWYLQGPESSPGVLTLGPAYVL